ncbi:MAG TPA: type VI secretion system protein TssA, partial [Longimicrobium sp.]|nr:type VI secretion system protein TssA [Longimicrobium sp.]
MTETELLEPIAGGNPAGPSLRGEPVYQQIKLARFEEDDVPQGEWRRERKTADFVQVVKLATDVLARQSKDLQVAAWLAEAWTRREGFAGLARGFRLLASLLDRFWDHVHPEAEDGDLELRAAPLEWVELYLGASVRAVPLTRAGHGLLAYRESRLVGFEEEAKQDSAKHAEWQAAVAAGKVSADAFDRGVAETPGAWMRERVAELDGAIADLGALEALCLARFGDEYAPRFIKLRETLQEVRHVAGQLLAKKAETDPDAALPLPESASADGAGGDETDPPSPSSATEGDRGDGSPASASPASPSASPARSASPEAADASASAGPPRSREDAAGRMAAVARWLRAQRPADPAPYLMVRGFRWGELRAGGPVPDPRLLAAPPTADRVRLKTLALEERWAELLEAAEEVMAAEHGRGWLDLQRHVATACAALGPDYDAVREGVAASLRALLRDLPTLPSLALMDDTPAAGAETLAWLREAGIVPAEGEAEAPPPAPRPGDAEARARARVAAGEPRKAVEILAAAAEREKSPRARFLLRAQAAAVMVDAGLEAVAVPILRELLEQVQRHALEEWEAGEMVARPLGLLYRCLGTLGDGGGE